ncbi:hypothetical protein DICPUDRAFT_159232 [Dictyostelium purpureum]|uniref:sphingomyelin phosphodiesterase n=1 Tax=Dictyostelium purpureum TaxID=5786 RepID=F1A3L7_DICPU|nr:uncharacterized protein DICPUDRAFT_159232 [Dictyostelium purpureum]EGC29213.1 hypothetical protein DICPUDRAFT_159232 [Dictyostelium purpureum]|eukprot:XP_003294259.1 hypothetical protein DICPUDRAFT_159232 [Dictyostelium purpureum]
MKNTDIKLLTYNVFIRPPGIRNNYDDYKDERIECMISENLTPHVLNKNTTSPQGIPNEIYSIDRNSFPYIPYFSPWKYPKYTQQKSKTPLEQQSLHNNSKDFKPINSKSILGQYDIICFQELFSAFSYRQRRFIEKAKQQGFKYYSASPLPAYLKSTFLVDGGLVVLSKYPIVATDYFLYEQGVDSDMLASKGVLYTKIKVVPNGLDSDDDNFIHLFTTHMQASYAPKVDKKTRKETSNPPPLEQQPNTINYPNMKNDNIRIIQINQLREFIIAKTFRDKSTIFLAGDLNVDGRTSKDDPRDSTSYTQMIDLLSTTNNKEYPNEYFPKDKKVFSITDLLKDDSNGNHPPTVGDIKQKKDNKGQIEEVPLETALTNPNDYKCMKRLDYILIFNREFEVSVGGVDIDKVQSPQGPSNHVVSTVKGSTKVEPFFIQGFPFTQLSDHYGVSTRIQVKK